MADPTVSQGTRGRLSYAQQSAVNIGLEDTQFDEKISLEMQHKHPLTRLVMKLGRETSRTIDVHYWEDQHVPERDQINYGTGYSSSDTDLTVDHGEYFAVGDLVRHENTDEVMLVTSISSDVLTVTRDFGQSTEGWTALADTIADNDYLVVLANSFEAGHPLPVFKHTITAEKINYCQDIRTPVKISEHSEDTDLRSSQDDLEYQKFKQAEKHHEKIEEQTIWGKPYRGDKGVYVAATGNTAPYEAGGINHFISEGADSDHLVDQTDLTEFEFLDFLEVGYDKGSDNKLLVCPPALRSAFDKWAITRQQTFHTTKVAGVAIQSWVTSHSDNPMFILTHDMLKNYGSDQYKYAFLLDMDELTYHTFGRAGMTSFRPAGNHDTNGATISNWEYMTISCITIKQANYHARLRFKTYSA